jgi:beta-mannosidase
VRAQALRQARAAVDLLAHHPSIALWCGHDEPAGPDLRGQLLPGWSRTILDPALARVLDEADGSRPVVASSGLLPHPTGGTDTHVAFGWDRGDDRDLARWLRRLPVLARFVSRFGGQAVPETAGWMGPEDWPHLDWDRLARRHGLQREAFERRVPPARFPTFDAWRAASQDHQAGLLRHQIEALRRLKYRPTGGFCQLLLADGHPAVSGSVLDHARVPKAGFAALREACAPVLVTADRPADWYRPGTPEALDVHVVSDLRRPLVGCTVQAELSWTGGSHHWGFAGDVPADAVARVGTLSFVVPEAPGPLTLDLRLTGAADATATYRSAVLPA